MQPAPQPTPACTATAKPASQVRTGASLNDLTVHNTGSECSWAAYITGRVVEGNVDLPCPSFHDQGCIMTYGIEDVALVCNPGTLQKFIRVGEAWWHRRRYGIWDQRD
jgi:hypothetical protein